MTVEPGYTGPVLTREQAIQRALDYAEGRLSCTNLMMQMEPGAEGENRQQTLVAIAQADAAEVVQWAALAAVLPSESGR